MASPPDSPIEEVVYELEPSRVPKPIPVALEDLCRQTKFTRQEIRVMYRGFKTDYHHYPLGMNCASNRYYATVSCYIENRTINFDLSIKRTIVEYVFDFQVSQMLARRRKTRVFASTYSLCGPRSDPTGKFMNILLNHILRQSLKNETVSCPIKPPRNMSVKGMSVDPSHLPFKLFYNPGTSFLTNITFKDRQGKKSIYVWHATVKTTITRSK